MCVCVCVCVCVQTSSSPSMDGVLEVLSKPPDDRTEEDIGEKHISTYVHTGLHTGFFMGGEGGTHISAASRGSGGLLPQKVFCILCWTLT